MRYYKAIFENNLTYKRGINKATKLGFALTRPNQNDGFHIVLNKTYYILKADGEIIKNPEEITDLNAKDWAIVVPSKRALEKLKRD